MAKCLLYYFVHHKIILSSCKEKWIKKEVLVSVWDTWEGWCPDPEKCILFYNSNNKHVYRPGHWNNITNTSKIMGEKHIQPNLFLSLSLFFYFKTEWKILKTILALWKDINDCKSQCLFTYDKLGQRNLFFYSPPLLSLCLLKTVIKQVNRRDHRHNTLISAKQLTKISNYIAWQSITKQSNR